MNSTQPDVLTAVTPVVEAVEQLGVRYHIGGSLASSAYGIPRATADVDLVAELDLERVDALVAQLQASYYVQADSVRQAVREQGSFNLIHLETMVKVDVFVPESRPFDRSEMSRARLQTLDVAEGARAFYLKSPEDLVLRKLEWYRGGGEVSERQWGDVIGVLKVQAGLLDREYLTHWAAQLGLTDLLESALAEASSP